MNKEMTPGFVSEIVYDRAQVAKYGEAWNELSKNLEGLAASYNEYSQIISGDDKIAPRLIVLSEGGDPVAIAPFVIQKINKKYTIGERRLFNLPATILQLVGRCFVGNQNGMNVRKIFNSLATKNDFDFVSLGEIELNGVFHRAIENGLINSEWRCAVVGHKVSIHWLIDLPASFEKYMGNFSGKTRSTLKRKIRKFDDQFGEDFRVISEVNDVDEFLIAGESISRLTYQWSVGQRFNNDEKTRLSYMKLAKAGSLRGYLMYAKGAPCAFMRGTIKNGVYNYETPGFDPELKKFSPGTVLLMKAIEDLINNTDCKVFDFGTGGDLVGYKKIFGNRSYEANCFEVGRLRRPYTFLLFGLQDALSRLKYLGNKILNDDLKRIIKRSIRK